MFFCFFLVFLFFLFGFFLHLYPNSHSWIIESISLLVKKNYHELRQIMQINLWYYTSSVFNLMFLVKRLGCIYDIMIRHRI